VKEQLTQFPCYNTTHNRGVLIIVAAVSRFIINPNARFPQALIPIRPGATNHYVHGLGLLYEITETATDSYLP